MRGLLVIAMLTGGLPIVTFVATLALSNGAPLQSPFRGSLSGSGMSAAVHVTPDIEPGQPAQKALAGIPTSVLTRSDVPPRVSHWQPPDSHRLSRHRTDAAWERLDREAAGGNRDALLFRTLMQSADFVRPVRTITP
jgi:hypothetical protein